MKNFLTAMALVTFGALGGKTQAQDAPQDDFIPHEMEMAEITEHIAPSYLGMTNFKGAYWVSTGYAVLRLRDLETGQRTMELSVLDQGSGVFGDEEDVFVSASYNPDDRKPHKVVTLWMFLQNMDSYRKIKGFGKAGTYHALSFDPEDQQRFQKKYKPDDCFAEIDSLFGVPLPR